jgi:catechol 2,3-dioxygenase-like lactoylglutathione lyase family enzyme
MSLSIAHVCINTTDLRKTAAFFTEALGLKKVFDFTKNGEVKGCYLEMSKGSFIEIFEVDDVNTKPSALAHLCLETDDIDRMKERLSAHGVTTTEKKKGCDDTYQIWFKDPNGIDIELHEYTASSAQLHPRDLEMDW